VEKESAPKKQFRLKKKSFFISLSVFILLAFVAAGVTYFLLKEREERLEAESEYNKLLEYCGEGDGDTLECKVLLGDFYESEDGKRDCMEIVLPVVDVDAREIHLCFKKGIVDWENPYDDYSLHVPVLMQIEGYRELYSAEYISVVVLEDEEAWGMVRETYDSEGVEPIPMWTQEYKEGINRGYDFVGREGGEDSFVPSGVTFHRGTILSYDLEGEEITLEVEAFVLGGEQVFSIETERFPLVNAQTGEGFWVTSENVDDIDVDSDYRVFFFLKNPALFSEDFIEEQVSLLLEGGESELLFDSLEVINE
jgi:hypothetical protein